MSIKVLVIDDSVERLVRLKRLLEAEQYEQERFEVITARDGVEGLEKLKQTYPDIILLDVHMPLSRLDGWATCLHIRREPGYEHGKRGVIMFSEVRRELVDIETGYYAGADRNLVTPFDDQQLVNEVKQLLHSLRFGPTARPSVANQAPKEEEDSEECERFDEHLTIYWKRHRIVIDGGEEQRLKHLQFKLLEYLRNHLNELCPYDDLKLYAWNNLTWDEIDGGKVSEEKLQEIFDVDYSGQRPKKSQTYMPGDGSLHRQISELRKILQDERYGYIQNEPKFGYRMVRKRHD